MSLNYLLDTNIVSEALRPAPNPVELILVTFNTQDFADFAGLELATWR